MTRFFERGTVMAEIERQMTMVPNFAPRGHGSAVLCRYRPAAADVDCRNCLEHRRRGCRSLTCLYLSERLEAGAVTLEELMTEIVQPWRHLPLRQRAMGLACREGGFHFDGQLHIMRMAEMTRGEAQLVNSRWLAAVYLLFCLYQFNEEILHFGEAVQFWMALALPFMLAYNRQRGPGLKWFFYVFYPAHLILLFWLANFVLK